jgi:general secretion pathway protein L
VSAKAPTAPLPPSILAEFSAWWMAELRGWFGSLVPSKRNETVHSPVDLAVDRNTVVVGADGSSFPADRLGEVFDALKRRGRNKRLHIRLNAGRFVRRRLAESRIPLSRAYRMAELDIAANTPFSPDEVYILFAESERGGTDYLLVKRGILDPLFEAMRARKYRLALVSADDGHTLHRLPNYVTDHFNGQRSALLNLAKRRFFSIACIAAAVFIAGNMLFTLEEAAAGVDAEIEKMEPAAKKARAVFKRRADSMARLQALSREKQAYLPTVRILEELTHIIPDETFLTDFTLDKQKIRISGFSTSAASLIAVVDASPLFANPKFTAAVVKVPWRNGEQFNMELDLEHVD